jgi:enamidase
MAQSEYWQRLYRKKLTRRRLLTGGAMTGLGLAAAAVVGCGDSANPTTTPGFTATRTPSVSRVATPTRTAAPSTPRQFLPASPAVPPPEIVFETQPIAILNGMLIDGTGAPAVQDAWVLLKDGRVEAVGSGASTVPPHGGYEEIDAGGKTIMPGLADAHVHISREVLKLEPGLVTNVTPDALLPFLRAGFTTLRDVGTNVLIFTGITGLTGGFYRNNQAPDVAWAGPIITCVGGYPITNVRYAPGGQEVRSAEEGAGLVDQLADNGARVIKLAIEHGYHVDEGWPVLSLEEVTAMTERAHARGLLVTAHVTSLDEVRLAIDGGVDDLAHTPLSRMPDELIAEMVAVGMSMVSTAIIWDSQSAQVSAENCKRFADAGGRVAIGTDYGCCGQIVGISSYLQEMQFLQAAGMTAMQLLTAATSGGATLANAGARTGTIEAGKRADVILVDADPLVSLVALNQVSTVINGGRPVASA